MAATPSVIPRSQSRSRQGRQHTIIDYPLQQGIRQVAFETRIRSVSLSLPGRRRADIPSPSSASLRPTPQRATSCCGSGRATSSPMEFSSHDNDLGPAALLQRIEHGVDAVNRRLRQQRRLGLLTKRVRSAACTIGNILHAIGSRTTEEGIRSTKRRTNQDDKQFPHIIREPHHAAYDANV